MANNKNKGGRPKVIIDWATVEKLCALHCTGEEISSFLKIDYDTLVAAIKREHKCSFSEYFKKHSAGGKLSLRRKQFEVAQSGNVSMLIWLGKQYLAQTDKIEQDNKSSDGSMTPKAAVISADDFAKIAKELNEEI